MKFHLASHDTIYTSSETTIHDTCCDALHAFAEIVADIMSSDMRDLHKNGNDVEIDIRVRSVVTRDDHDEPKLIKFLMTDYPSSYKSFPLAEITRVDD